MIQPASHMNKKVDGLVDLHAHLAVHIPYWFMIFGGTPERNSSPGLSFSHAHSQHMNLDLLRKSEVKIYVHAALVNIWGFNKKNAESQVIRQFEYVENLAKKYSQDFAVAHTPFEARQIIASGKMAWVHAMEGAEFLIDSFEDAQKWRQRGVAMIAPIHLMDNLYGDASIMPGIKTVVNINGWFKRTFVPRWRKGLTQLGKKANENLIKAGIIIDTAHMSHQSLEQTLAQVQSAQTPLIMSHGFVREIRNEERGLTDEQIRSIYQLGGMVAVTGGLPMLHPHGKISAPLFSGHCHGSLDDYLLHIGHLEKLLGKNECPIALGTDFNGFVSHLRPRCEDLKKSKSHPSQSWDVGEKDFRLKGLAGPHLIPSMMKCMEKRDVGVSSYLKSAERFLTIWEQAHARNA